ncbi:hypothetical protein JL722_5229 [Aureococcus anophagefferens]|nr:hypothetical protein JL722_5229 [Aureococcus anophagefferens]
MNNIIPGANEVLSTPGTSARFITGTEVMTLCHQYAPGGLDDAHLPYTLSWDELLKRIAQDLDACLVKGESSRKCIIANFDSADAPSGGVHWFTVMYEMDARK